MYWPQLINLSTVFSLTLIQEKNLSPELMTKGKSSSSKSGWGFIQFWYLFSYFWTKCLIGSQSWRNKNEFGFKEIIIFSGEYSKMHSGHSYQIRTEFCAVFYLINFPYLLSFTLIIHEPAPSIFIQGERNSDLYCVLFGSSWIPEDTMKPKQSSWLSVIKLHEYEQESNSSISWPISVKTSRFVLSIKILSFVIINICQSLNQ